MTPDPHFPIGPMPQVETLSPAQRREHIGAIRALSGEFRAALEGLTEAQLDTPYRVGGWTLRQLAHHLPDSHLNAYLRCKLALTEDTPTIKPYDEAAWAELPDSRGEVAVSLALLDALHARWVSLLEGLDESQWVRPFFHPGSGGTVTLDGLLATYAWHGRHHTAHATALRERMGW